MHILLTGGTGLIGRQLCKHWLAQGHRLRCGAGNRKRSPGCAVRRCSEWLAYKR